MRTPSFPSKHVPDPGLETEKMTSSIISLSNRPADIPWQTVCSYVIDDFPRCKPLFVDFSDLDTCPPRCHPHGAAQRHLLLLRGLQVAQTLGNARRGAARSAILWLRPGSQGLPRTLGAVLMGTIIFA